MRSAALIGLLALLLVPLPPASAQEEKEEEEPTPEDFIYQFTDDEGVIHFVDELTKVPPKYRDDPGLRKIPVGPPEPDPPVSSSSGSGAGTYTRPSYTETPTAEEPTPAPTNEERLHDLRRQRDDLMSRIVQLEEGYGDPDAQQRSDEELSQLLDQSEKLLLRVEKEIEKLEEANR